MAEGTYKSFKDKISFEQIFNSIFAKNQIFIKLQDVRIKCEYLGFADDIIKLKIESPREIPGTCLLLARHQDEIYSAHLQFVKNADANKYIFKPIEIRHHHSPRKDEREKLEPEKKNDVLFINSIMSDFLIEKSLVFESKKVKYIEDVIKIKLESTFNYIRVFLINEGTDPRMAFFRDSMQPIFIPDMRQSPEEKQKKLFEFYKNEVYKKDGLLQNRKNLVSEISVPILYRMKIPYGFVQVNNETPMQESQLSTVKKMAVIAEELMQKNRIFDKEEVKLLVVNISKSGIGIAFKERKHIRYFKENCLIYFDLLLPNNKKANMTACVRHISQISNKIYKVGCEFKEMDALSEVYFDEFLEKIGKKE